MDPRIKWARNNPDKRLAHSRVQDALEMGTLTRQPCEGCGATRVHAHHDDYAKPLDVRWLCPRCHRRHHLGDKAPYTRKPQPYQYKPRPATVARRAARAERQAQAATLRSEGLSYSQIGAELGLSIGTVYKWLNETPYD